MAWMVLGFFDGFGNVDPLLINPFPLVGIIIRILI